MGRGGDRKTPAMRAQWYIHNVKCNPAHLSSFVDPVALGHKHRFQEWLEMRDLLRVELNEPDLLYLDGVFET